MLNGHSCSKNQCTCRWPITIIPLVYHLFIFLVKCVSMLFFCFLATDNHPTLTCVMYTTLYVSTCMCTSQDEKETIYINMLCFCHLQFYLGTVFYTTWLNFWSSLKQDQTATKKPLHLYKDYRASLDPPHSMNKLNTSRLYHR